ncbi:hypothetical protein [Pseudolysinimonas sp.]
MNRSIATAVVRVAVRLAPPDVRDARREEWLADLEHGAEVDYSSSQIALGALVSAVSEYARHGRTHPSPNGALPVSEHIKFSIRLALYAAWIVLSAVWIWTWSTQAAATSASGSGPQFQIGGSYIWAAVPMMIAGIVSLILGAGLAVRSVILHGRAMRDIDAA